MIRSWALRGFLTMRMPAEYSTEPPSSSCAELALDELDELVGVDVRRVLLVGVVAEGQHAAARAAARAGAAGRELEAQLRGREVGRAVDDLGHVVELEDELLDLVGLRADLDDLVLDPVGQRLVAGEDEVQRVLEGDVPQAQGDGDVLVVDQVLGLAREDVVQAGDVAEEVDRLLERRLVEVQRDLLALEAPVDLEHVLGDLALAALEELRDGEVTGRDLEPLVARREAEDLLVRDHRLVDPLELPAPVLDLVPVVLLAVLAGLERLGLGAQLGGLDVLRAPVEDVAAQPDALGVLPDAQRLLGVLEEGAQRGLEEPGPLGLLVLRGLAGGLLEHLAPAALLLLGHALRLGDAALGVGLQAGAVDVVREPADRLEDAGEALLGLLVALALHEELALREDALHLHLGLVDLRLPLLEEDAGRVAVLGLLVAEDPAHPVEEDLGVGVVRVQVHGALEARGRLAVAQVLEQVPARLVVVVRERDALLLLEPELAAQVTELVAAVLRVVGRTEGPGRLGSGLRGRSRRGLLVALAGLGRDLRVAGLGPRPLTGAAGEGEREDGQDRCLGRPHDQGASLGVARGLRVSASTPRVEPPAKGAHSTGSPPRVAKDLCRGR
jgi:hypothetical protein